MEYHKTITLKDGRACTLRNGTAEDGQALLKIFNLTHTQTDYLLTYPEEHSYTAEDEAELLRRKTDSADEIQENEYAVGDRKAMEAGGGKYLNFIKFGERQVCVGCHKKGNLS